jgi:hypothetical protein
MSVPQMHTDANMQMEWLQDDLAEVVPVGEKWPKMFK